MRPHPFLFPLSMVYGPAVWLRNLFFDIGIFTSTDVSVPVISVGNLTAGGTGKTPVVREVVRILTGSGKRTAVISRGYGRRSAGTVVVSDGTTILADVRHSGDEPMLIAKSCAGVIVISDEDRVRGSRKAVDEYGAEVIVLDDGFQHRRIARTKDIVLMDSRQMPFETMMLPAGYRREFISAIRRADAVLLTKSTDLNEAKRSLSDERLKKVQNRFSSSFTPSGIKHLFGGVKQSTEILKGHSVVAFCGIASPDGFRRSIVQCGASVKEMFAFADHHTFTREEIAMVVGAFHRSGADFILTTEKDAVRLDGFEGMLGNVPVSALEMDVVIHQADDWKRFVLEGI